MHFIKTNSLRWLMIYPVIVTLLACSIAKITQTPQSIEVTRVVEVSVEVPIEVTRIVEVPVEVPVEVTRVVEVTRTV